MIIGFITRKVTIPRGSLSRYLIRSYDFASVDLKAPAINVAQTFARTQGYEASENDYLHWHQLLSQTVDPEYRINYMNHMIHMMKQRNLDIVVEGIEYEEELKELKRNGGKVVFITGCNCEPNNVDIVLRANDIVSAYGSIDKLMERYRIEKS